MVGQSSDCWRDDYFHKLGKLVFPRETRFFWQNQKKDGSWGWRYIYIYIYIYVYIMYIHIFFCLLSSLNLTEHGVIIPHLEHTPNHKGKNLLAVPWIQSICRSKNISWYLRCVFSECTPSWYHLVFIWYSYGITWYHMAHGIWHHMVSLAYGIVLVLSLSIIPLPWHRRSHDGHFDGAHTSADGGMFRSRQLLGCRGVAVQGKTSNGLMLGKLGWPTPISLGFVTGDPNPYHLNPK